MSIGFKARAVLALSDDSGFLYTYACCNLNREGCWRDAWEKEDGEIWISRVSLVEPDIHVKTRKLPSGRKKTVVKRVPREVPVREMIAEGKITVKNAFGTWKTTENVDMMALRLLYKILTEYQLLGKMPEDMMVVY